MDSGIGSSILSISSSDEEFENNNIRDSFDDKNDSDMDKFNNKTVQQEKFVDSEDDEELAFVSFLNQTVLLHKELNNTSLSLHQLSLLPEDNFSILNNTMTPLRKSDGKSKTYYNYDSRTKLISNNINLISPMTPIPLQDDSIYNVSLDLSGSPDLIHKLSENIKSNITTDKRLSTILNKKNSSMKKSNEKNASNQYARPSPLNYKQGFSKYYPHYTSYHDSKIPLFLAHDANSNSDNETHDSHSMGVGYNSHYFTGGIPIHRNYLSSAGYAYPSQFWRDRLRKREMTSILGSPKSKFLFQ